MLWAAELVYLLGGGPTCIMLHKLKELESSNRAKQKYLTIISHDLINPFNVMMGYSTLLKEEYSKISDGERKRFEGRTLNQRRFSDD